MSGKWGRIKITLISLLVVAALGGILLAGKALFAPDVHHLLKRGEDLYSAGLVLLNADEGATAIMLLEEANSLADKALEKIGKEQPDADNQGNEAATARNHEEGRAFWLKARALRDLCFARGLADEQPLPEARDALTGETFRSAFAIPDDRVRGEILDCLRQAGRRLTDAVDVQREVLRTELMYPDPDWKRIGKLAHHILELDSKDASSLYLLARIEFEQPSGDGVDGTEGPTPPTERSGDRILRARAYLQALKETNSYPLWRTLLLEAEIAHWLRDHAAQHGDRFRQRAEEKMLHEVLLAPATGALARAAAGEGMEHLADGDVQALLDMHRMAMDLIGEDTPQPEKVARTGEVLAATLSLCRRLADANASWTGEAARTAVLAMTKAQAALAREPPPDWSKDLDLVLQLARNARDQNMSQPHFYEAVAVLLSREAAREGKHGSEQGRDERNKQSLQWIEEGLRRGKEAHLAAVQLVALQAMAAEMKINLGERPEQVTGHLAALKKAGTPRALALAALLGATAAERAGRLDQARTQLEQVLDSPEGDLVARAHRMLSDIYLALGQPDKGLLSLHQAAQLELKDGRSGRDTAKESNQSLTGYLRQSLFALVQTNPRKARELAVLMSKDFPDEPLPLLASAQACLLLDEIGTPADAPDPGRSMAAALNAWEQRILHDSSSRVTVSLTKSAYWVQASRSDLGLAEAVQALDIDPKNEAALRQAINLALNLGDPDLWPLTQQRLDILKQVQPKRPEPQLLQARLHELNGRATDARKIYEDLLQHDAKQAAAYDRLIDLLIRQGTQDQARAWTQRWRKALPEDARAAQAEIRLLASAGQLAEARRAAEEFVQAQVEREKKRLEAVKPAAGADPKAVEKQRHALLERLHRNLWLELTQGLFQAKAWNESEAWLRPILDQQPDHPLALLMLGNVYIQKKSWPEARDIYVKYLAQDPFSIPAGNNLAWILAKHLHDVPAALRVIQQVRKGRFSGKPISADRLPLFFLDTLGFVYTRTNKATLYPEMRDIFVLARQRYPRSPRLCLYLGNAYAGLGEGNKAENMYRETRKLVEGVGGKGMTPQERKELLEDVEAARKKQKQTSERISAGTKTPCD